MRLHGGPACFDRRDLREEEAGAAPDLVFLELEPLLIALDEDEEPQRNRLRAWLEQVKIQGVAQWLKYL